MTTVDMTKQMTPIAITKWMPHVDMPEWMGDSYRYAKADRRKPMRPQPHTKNYTHLRDNGGERNSFSHGRTH